MEENGRRKKKKKKKRKSYGPHQVFRRKTGDTTFSGNIRPAGVGHHGATIQV